MPDQFPDATKMVPLSTRVALAVCPRYRAGAQACPAPCDDCHAVAAAAAHEIADYFGERYGGSSTTADALYAVGFYPCGAPAGWLPIGPGQEAAANSIARELRRPDA